MSNIKQWIETYEAGQEIESVSMGGISEGYENAIQSLAIEIGKELSEVIIPEDNDEAKTIIPEDNDEAKTIISMAQDKAVKKLNEKHGFSGAQAGAAKNLAWNVWRRGTESFKDIPDRIIKIKKVDHINAVVVNYQEI